MRKYIIGLLLLVITSCVENKFLPEKTVEPFAKITDQLPNSSFVGEFAGITVYKDKYYIVDCTNHCIMIFDKKLNYINKIGRQGSGPGEFRYPNKLRILKDSLFVLDRGNKRVNVFSTDGVFYRSFNINCLEELANNPRSLIFEDNIIIASTPLKENIITVYNNDNKKISGFGMKRRGYNTQMNYVQNSCFIAVDSNGYVVALKQTSPTIERYTLAGRIVDTLSLRDIPMIRYRAKEIEDNLLRENLSRPGAYSIMPLFTDMTLSKDRIFISLVEKSENGNISKTGKVLVVLYNKDKMEAKEIIIPQMKGNDGEQFEQLQYANGQLIQCDIINKILYFYKLPD